MKKINSVIGWKGLGKAENIKKLSQEEMEYVIENCPMPWLCPEDCYKSCIGCFQRKNGGGLNYI